MSFCQVKSYDSKGVLVSFLFVHQMRACKADVYKQRFSIFIQHLFFYVQVFLYNLHSFFNTSALILQKYMKPGIEKHIIVFL